MFPPMYGDPLMNPAEGRHQVMLYLSNCRYITLYTYVYIYICDYIYICVIIIIKYIYIYYIIHVSIK